MLATMYTIIFILASLAFIGHGRRMYASTRQSPSSQSFADRKQPTGSAQERGNSIQALASLLKVRELPAAFNPALGTQDRYLSSGIGTKLPRASSVPGGSHKSSGHFAPAARFQAVMSEDGQTPKEDGVASTEEASENVDIYKMSFEERLEYLTKQQNKDLEEKGDMVDGIYVKAIKDQREEAEQEAATSMPLSDIAQYAEEQDFSDLTKGSYWKTVLYIVTNLKFKRNMMQPLYGIGRTFFYLALIVGSIAGYIYIGSVFANFWNWFLYEKPADFSIDYVLNGDGGRSSANIMDFFMNRQSMGKTDIFSSMVETTAE